MTRWHVIFSGRVQHVGFRYTAYYFTRDLYLTGWVDNRPDGTVEMEVQGPPLLLQRLPWSSADKSPASEKQLDNMFSSYA